MTRSTAVVTGVSVWSVLLSQFGEPGQGSSGVVTTTVLVCVPAGVDAGTVTSRVITTAGSVTCSRDASTVQVNTPATGGVQSTPSGSVPKLTKLTPAGSVSVTVAATPASDGPRLSTVMV